MLKNDYEIIDSCEKKTEEPPIVLKLKGVAKSFSGVKVLDGVDMEIRKGEIHALVGENGAGKSTLMKMIYGIYNRDEGEIIYMGNSIKMQNALMAKKGGIVFIQQELSIVPHLSVAENIFLGSLPTRKFNAVDWPKLNADTRKILDELKCNFSERANAGSLSIANQQMVEIARALAFKPQLIIFDEPTSSLTGKEKDILFEVIKAQKAKGISIIYISHKMDEIFDFSDRITVLRDGKKTGTLVTGETDELEITKLMIGRNVDTVFEKCNKLQSEEIFRVEGLSHKGCFEDISFSIHKGEVLGMYGLIGAGRSEIAETLFALRKRDSGSIYMDNQKIDLKNTRQAVKMGIGLVPENRKSQGMVSIMSCVKNLSLVTVNRLHTCGIIKNREETRLFNQYQTDLDIKTACSEKLILQLSGGNQQKIIIAKWMASNPRVFILDEPTRGIDIGSKMQVHTLIRQMAEKGIAVLVISSEMPEIIRVCDRVLTVCSGRINSELIGDQITEKNLIRGAFGQVG